MLLHQQVRTPANTVTGYGKNYIEVNETAYHYAVFFRPDGIVEHWPVNSLHNISYDLLKLAAGVVEKAKNPFDMLNEDSISSVQFDNSPELMLIGTGKHQVFLSHELLAPFLKAGIGVECMDSQAAARTYNVLMAEGRIVAIALLPSD